MSAMIKCSICGEEIEEDRSNNAWPINEGRCCGMCNARVMKARLELHHTQPQPLANFV
jgi:hypothetical protein